MKILILLLISLYVISIYAQYKESSPDVEIITLDDPIASTKKDDSIIRALKVTKIGFNSAHSMGILLNLLNNPVSTVSDKKQYELFRTSHGHLVAISDTIPGDTIPSDTTFLYLDKTSFVDDNIATRKLESALQSLVTVNSTIPSKRSLLIAVPIASQSKEQVSTLLEKLTLLMSSAWSIIKKHVTAPEDVSEAVDIQFISVSPQSTTIGTSGTNLVNKVFDRLSNETRPLESLYDMNITAPVKPIVQIDARISIKGVGSLDIPITSAIIVGRNALIESQKRLIKAESSDSFSTFIQNLQSMCIDQLREDAMTIGVFNPTILRAAEDEVRSTIYSMSYPLFRAHVDYAMKEAVRVFNLYIVDLDLTKLSSDLRSHRNKAVNGFKSSMKKLTPPNAPSSWNTDFEFFSLSQTFDDYIARREDAARIMGVLPRNRRPVEISFHTFLSHPIGRDYRQDVVLGSQSKDTPYYDHDAAKAKDVLIPPHLARSIFKQQLVSSGGKNVSGFTARDSEFAREMLMFPLSIKNPEVAMVSGKGRRRAALLPKKDHNREKEGPERFIRWDISPLDEVKKNLDTIQSAYAKTQSVPVLDMVLNLIPNLGHAYYTSPPLQYGSKFAPSSSVGSP